MVPARLRFTAGTVTAARDTPLSEPVVIPVLNRLNRLIDKADGETDKQFQRRQQIWQSTMKAIERAFVAINARVDEVAILARISAVEQLAEVANDNAVSAKATAETVAVAAEETFATIDPTLADTFNNGLEER
jgi:uncharacterized protein YukE